MAQINKPTDYFNTVLWTGNGTDDRSITGVGFKPDWVWYKERSNVGDHTVHDIVRGAGERLFTAGTSAESLDANSLQAFESDGFQIGTNSDVNGNNETYVGWNWYTGATASSNTDGSITSNVSANTTSGFSIVSYTGTASNATVGHGLGVAPACFITKSRVNAENWGFYHQSLGNGKQLELNTTAEQKTSSAYYNNTSPTSTVFSIGTADSTNDNQNMIAYCFAEKKGFSKFGKYVGNNNDDGTFVYLGFKPAFLLIKIIDTQTDNWIMQDNKRNTSNLSTSQRLRANSSGAEFSSSNEIDLLSNGFKCHGADGEFNGSGASYIYMAFAENPLVGTNNIPAVAR